MVQRYLVPNEDGLVVDELPGNPGGDKLLASSDHQQLHVSISRVVDLTRENNYIDLLRESKFYFYISINLKQLPLEQLVILTYIHTIINSA